MIPHRFHSLWALNAPLDSGDWRRSSIIYGDRHGISPDPFAGRRNFADPADAPGHTLGAAWHFKPLTAVRVRRAQTQ